MKKLIATLVLSLTILIGAASTAGASSTYSTRVERAVTCGHLVSEGLDSEFQFGGDVPDLSHRCLKVAAKLEKWIHRQLDPGYMTYVDLAPVAADRLLHAIAKAYRVSYTDIALAY